MKDTNDLKKFQDKIEKNNDSKIKVFLVVEVEFLKVVIVCKDRPHGNIDLDFQKALTSDK